MRIDAHQHFWQVARGDYSWMDANDTILYRDYLPADLLPALDRYNIDYSIVVQAAPTTAETRFLFELAAANERIGGIVGWLDFDGADAVEQLDSWVSQWPLLGLRPMIQDIKDKNWLLRSNHRHLIRAMVDRGVAFDALVKPQHLAVLDEWLTQYPELTVIIDHGAKPHIADGDYGDWSSALTRIAERHQNTYCKLSGLTTEAGRDWRVEQMRPYVESILSAFGTRRVLWGSDWPVVNIHASYGDWMAACSLLLAGLSLSEHADIFCDSALRAYPRLKDYVGDGF